MATKSRPAARRTRKAKRSSASARTASGRRKKRSAPKDPLARAKALAERGAFGEAILAAEALLDADPRQWPARRFIAHVLWQCGHAKEAMQFFESAIMTAPDKASVQIELASTLALAAQKSAFMTDRAIALAEKTMARHGPTVALLLHVSGLHFRRGAKFEALATAERAVSLFPDSRPARQNLSVALLMCGREADALAAYAATLKPYRARPSAGGAKVPRQYAKLAAGYDDNALHQLFSERMATFIADTIGSTADARVLDAGCGTGLLGTHLKAARLTGIDLSSDMIEKARTRNVYHQLIEGDLVGAMAKLRDRFDLVVSSCVLYHIADLSPFFRESARLLVPGGRLFFSVDPAPDDMDIGESVPGEYAHSRAYLRRLAAEHGLSEAAIAVMGHRATPGFWCAFRKGSLENAADAT